VTDYVIGWKQVSTVWAVWAVWAVWWLAISKQESKAMIVGVPERAFSGLRMSNDVSGTRIRPTVGTGTRYKSSPPASMDHFTSQSSESSRVTYWFQVLCDSLTWLREGGRLLRGGGEGGDGFLTGARPLSTQQSRARFRLTPFILLTRP